MLIILFCLYKPTLLHTLAIKPIWSCSQIKLKNDLNFKLTHNFQEIKKLDDSIFWTGKHSLLNKILLCLKLTYPRCPLFPGITSQHPVANFTILYGSEIMMRNQLFAYVQKTKKFKKRYIFSIFWIQLFCIYSYSRYFMTHSEIIGFLKSKYHNKIWKARA